ncbi:hypothetical protein [Nocardia nepalensis]|uniref:hypothetical protein n=1 Tax=Nocardia nepalensis TaxID=3375448 RepID=UPI003B678BDE
MFDPRLRTLWLANGAAGAAAVTVRTPALHSPESRRFRSCAPGFDRRHGPRLRCDARVVIGDTLRHAGIMKLDPDTGAVLPFAAGLGAADGKDVAADGTVYATNDFGSLIGRVYATP